MGLDTKLSSIALSDIEVLLDLSSFLKGRSTSKAREGTG